MKRIIALICVLIFLSGCGAQETERTKKDKKSAKYGLNRILTVYDQNGRPIKTYEGKFDIDANKDANGGSNGTKIKFDIPTGDGKDTKRVIIYNAVVICEEK